MGTSVKYRDLPGGPGEIKFADEISRLCLCGKCGMISTSMYRDPDDHMFCQACLLAQSEQYGKHDIYCEYERRNIDIEEMEEAFDLLTVLRDQYVECPNRKRCGQQVHFGNLKEHYITCQPELKCSSCGTELRSSEWEAHNYNCSRRGEDRAASKKASTSRQSEREPPLPAPPKPDDIPKFQNASATSKTLYPFGRLKKLMESTPGFTQDQQVVQANEDPKTESPASCYCNDCPYCGRKVKDINMRLHLLNCSKSPVDCAFCNKRIDKENKWMHEERCKFTPQNRPKAKETDRGKEDCNFSAKNMQSSQSYGSTVQRQKGSASKPSSSDTPPPRNNVVSTQPKKNEKRVDQKKPSKQQAQHCTRENSASKADNAKGTKDPATSRDESSAIAPPNHNAHSAYSPRKPSPACDRKCASENDYSSVSPAFSQGAQISARNVPWFRYLRAGDLSTALVVMEEWFRTNKTEGEQEKYERLAPALIEANLRTYVSDVMRDPSQTHPFSCLVTALLARVWLPQHLSARQEVVTWEDVLDYTPSFLVTRLTKRAKTYLYKHPVFNSKDASTTIGDVVEDSARPDVPGVQPSSVSSDLHTDRSIPDDPEACRKPSPDTSDITDESPKQQTPEADKRPFKRADIHRNLSKTSCLNIAAGFPEKRGAEDNDGNIRTEAVAEDREARNRASSAPCDDAVSRKNGLNRKVRSASTSHPTTKEQDPHANAKQSECTDIERIISEKLGLHLSKFSGKRGAGMETPGVSEDRTASKGSYDTTRQEVFTANSGSHQEACSSSGSHVENRNGSSLHSSEGSVPELTAFLTEKRGYGKCVKMSKVKYETLFGENGQGRSVSPKGSSADRLDPHVSGHMPVFTERHSETAGAGKVPNNTTCSDAISSHELETQSTCSDLRKAELDTSATLTSMTNSDGVRLRYVRNVPMTVQRDERSLLSAPIQAARHHNRVICHEPCSRCGDPGTRGVMTQEARSHVCKYDTESSVSQVRLVQERRREDAGQAPCLQEADYRSRSKSSDPLRTLPDIDPSVTGERSSLSARLNSGSEQGKQEARHKPSGPNESTSVKEAGKLDGKQLSLSLDGESEQYAFQEHKFRERNDKAVSCRSSPKASVNTYERSAAALKSGGHSVPKHRTTRELRDSIVKSAKYPPSLINSGQDGGATQLTASQDSLRKEQRDLRSRSHECVQSTTHETRRTAAQVGSVEMPQPEVKIVQPETGYDAVSVPKAPFAEGISAYQGSRTSANALQRSENLDGRYQVDVPCGRKLDDPNTPNRERRTSDTMRTPHSESVRPALQALCSRQERPAKEENLSASLDDENGELFLEQETSL